MTIETWGGKCFFGVHLQDTFHLRRMSVQVLKQGRKLKAGADGGGHGKMLLTAFMSMARSESFLIGH